MESAAAPLPSLVLHDPSTRDEIDPRSITKTWLESLQSKISQGQLQDVSDLFIDASWWRDIVGLSWNITTKRGTSKISQYLQTQAPKSGFGKFAVIQQGVLQPRLSDLGGLIWIESGFTFETKAGTGRGILRLSNTGPRQWKAWIVHTTLEELKGFPEHPPQEISTHHETKDIQVLIIGAGQSGLALAARLKALNVKTLTVDKGLQIGDSWKNRYKSLKSHTPRYTDHYPYLDFPTDFPEFLARNDIISWMDHYQKSMGLNVELGVTVGKINYDNLLRHYAVEIESQDGTKRVVTPRHVVLATGLFSDTPVRPEFENEGSFNGQIYHSSSHQSASQIPNLEGKKIVIVGAGTSAHDIAQDFVTCGAKTVAMIQRSPQFVLSTEAQDNFVFAGWKMMPTRDADLVGTSFPQAIALTLIVGATQMMAQHDAALLAEMEKAGMAIKRGEDGIGLLHHQLLKGGHFYIDQGACKMIADGRIKVQQSQEGVKGFDQKSVVLGNGTRVEADVVVLATGFHPAAHLTERIMGKEFSAKVGEVGSLDDEDERVAWWRPSAAAPGFWYMTGSLLWSRTFSKPLALQIKAIEEGLNPDHYPSPA
ncbi:putative indole-3-pyruvate monooxygenase [Lachnellula willkommii]|uniref:Putative indole-3-pyruvate monooxygenase n=1 Tax=Lachnellula willkommii TaxID=215461 RepID=A0A559MN99_9HELO|nr:putative indole-3-pyruvate monooxygenase [Lachnellula willkommii]